MPGYEVFSVTADAKPDQDDAAFKSIYTEAQRIYKHGFTQGELDRAKTNLLTSCSVETMPKMPHILL